jgi:hypothetical protein
MSAVAGKSQKKRMITFRHEGTHVFRCGVVRICVVAYKFLNMVVVEQPRATNSIEDIDVVVDCGKQYFRIVSHEQSEFTERRFLSQTNSTSVESVTVPFQKN